MGGASPATVASMVALQLDLTPELRAEGLARELVRVVQDARNGGARGQRPHRARAGPDGDLAEALSAHRDRVAAETLATEIVSGRLPDPAFEQDFDVDGATVVGLRRT